MTRKIVKYGFATDSDDEGFYDIINDQISKGWQPFGGISIAYTGHGILFFAQAIVKYEEEAGEPTLEGTDG